jgi:hypothetical protein
MYSVGEGMRARKFSRTSQKDKYSIQSVRKTYRKPPKKNKKKIEYLDINNCYSTKYADSILRKTTSNLIIINYYFNVHLITTIRLNDYLIITVIW